MAYHEPYHTVDVYCRALHRSYGLVDHYFLEFDDFEHHLGYYKKGNRLPANSTKNRHHVARKILCDCCFAQMKADYHLNEDKRLFGYYPLINCETLSTGMSVQSLTLLVIPFAIFALLRSQVFLALVLLVLAFSITLVYGKYVRSRTVHTVCSHLVTVAAAAATPSLPSLQSSSSSSWKDATAAAAAAIAEMYTPPSTPPPPPLSL